MRVLATLGRLGGTELVQVGWWMETPLFELGVDSESWDGEGIVSHEGSVGMRNRRD